MCAMLSCVCKCCTESLGDDQKIDTVEILAESYNYKSIILSKCIKDSNSLFRDLAIGSIEGKVVYIDEYNNLLIVHNSSENPIFCGKAFQYCNYK